MKCHVKSYAAQQEANVGFLLYVWLLVIWFN